MTKICTRCGAKGHPERDFYTAGRKTVYRKPRRRAECKRCTNGRRRVYDRRTNEEIREIRSGARTVPHAEPTRAQLQHAQDRADRTLELAFARLEAARC